MADDEAPGNSRVARKVYATEDGSMLISHMVENVGLWEDRIHAAMFLGTFAAAMGAEPTQFDEKRPGFIDGERVGHVDLGPISHLTRSIRDPEELVLFQLVQDDPDRTLDEVLVDDLKGYIETGRRYLGDVLHATDPQSAILDELQALLDGGPPGEHPENMEA